MGWVGPTWTGSAQSTREVRRSNLVPGSLGRSSSCPWAELFFAFAFEDEEEEEEEVAQEG